MLTEKSLKVQDTINLTYENSYKSDRVKIGRYQETRLTGLVVKYFRDLGVDTSEVLSSYRPGYLNWPIPPLSLPGEFFGEEFSYAKLDNLNLQAEFRSYRDTVIRLDKLKDRDGLIQYVTGCVTLLQANTSYKRFVSNSTSLYLEYRTVPPIGIKEGKVLGAPVWTNVAMLDMTDYMQSSRGITEVDTFDALDRAKIWIENNWEMLPDYENLEYALAILKLAGSKSAGYNFEQALHKPEVYVSDKFSKLFTTEALDEVRDLWSSSAPIRTRFEKLYDKLIDKFIDSKAWKEIFGSFPPPKDEEMTVRKVRQAERGMERFIVYFLSRQRMIKEGKLC